MQREKYDEAHISRNRHYGEKIPPRTGSRVSYLGITNFIAANLSKLTLSQTFLAKLKQDCQEQKIKGVGN